MHVISDVEVTEIHDERPLDKRESPLPYAFSKSYDWPIWVELTNGSLYGCDLVIEATGVVPNSALWKRDCPEVTFRLIY